jgi:prevent-host-death family protein
MDTTITALEMRQSLGEILDRVAKKGEHITITRANKPLAVLIPPDDHQEYCTIHKRAKTIEEAMADVEKWQKKNAHKLAKMGKTDSAAIVRRMRDSRYGRR